MSATRRSLNVFVSVVVQMMVAVDCPPNDSLLIGVVIFFDEFPKFQIFCQCLFIVVGYDGMLDAVFYCGPNGS